QEIAPLQYNVVWKTPAQWSNVPLRPTWPDSCAVRKASEPQLEGTGVVSSWQLQCAQPGGGGIVGQTLGVSGLGANQASAIVMISLLDGRHYQQVLNAEQAQFVIPAESTAGDVAGDYTWLGMEHIWGGLDHLLFVFGLLLLVGGGRRLLWTVTAFTAGHSITLSLVTLGIFDYPVALVELAIALSIFILAVELTRTGKHDALWRNPWWLAGGFGLLHGMGFAGALSEAGLPQDNVPLALLFFNVGIEVGQLAFILVILAIWSLMRRPLASWQDKLLPVPIYILGSLSAMWCIERGLAAVLP
ncbi:MAG: HupE/UreJ family protein, partial [Chromatocurvus sp.]